MSRAPGTPLHTLVLSPHLDDGVLSCGGELNQLAARGERTAVATLFTADMSPADMGPVNPTVEAAEPTSFARKVFHYMNLDWRTGMAERRQEDVEACRVLGSEALHFGLSEAINRFVPCDNPVVGHCPYGSSRTLFGAPHAEDERAVSKQLDALLSALPPAQRWLVPLGIGGHVDHRLVRAAAERCAKNAQVEFVYYEDFPYNRRRLNRLRALGMPWQRRLVAATVQLEASDLEQKIQAIAAYGSQIDPLFGDLTGLAAAVHGDAKRCGGGERRWRSVTTTQ